MTSTFVRPNNRGTNPDHLTDRQRLFVHEYLADDRFNAADAARKAGYKVPGSSASKLLRDEKVARYLGRRLRQRMDRCDLSADRIVKELSYLGLADPRALFDERGNPIPIEQLPSEIARAVESIDIVHTDMPDGSRRTRIKVTLHSKIKALELLARHMGLLDKRIQVEHGVDQDVIAALLKAVEGRSNVIDDAYIERKRQQSLEPE